jgi:ATP-dependent Clp protease adaptor protein ClpS
VQETAHILKEKMAQTQIDSVVNIKPIIEIPEPPMFKVIYINDELTSMEFVVRTLVNHFNYTSDTAINITTGIHDSGSAVVAVLPYEIAEQKGIEVTMEARTEGFPLQVKIEAES